MTVSVTWYHDVSDAVPREVDNAVGAAAGDILLRANRGAPRLTGALIQQSEVRRDPPGFRYVIEYHVPYAARQHWTNRTRRQWLRASADVEEGQLERTISARVRSSGF